MARETNRNFVKVSGALGSLLSTRFKLLSLHWSVFRVHYSNVLAVIILRTVVSLLGRRVLF